MRGALLVQLIVGLLGWKELWAGSSKGADNKVYYIMMLRCMCSPFITATWHHCAEFRGHWAMSTVGAVNLSSTAFLSDILLISFPFLFKT